MSLPTSGPQQPPHQPQPEPTSATSHLPRSSTESRGNSLPFSLKPNPSPTSLVSSTAEGRPIPVDDSTVEYRTTALRELNSHYPSRHRYAKSTGAQNSTYSEPVIVRSYHPPLPSSRPSSASRGPAVHGGSVSGSGSGSQVGRLTEAIAAGLPLPSRLVSGDHGMLSTMVLSFGKKPVNGRAEDEARLPPIEAFSFKSFMANIEAQGGGTAGAGDINADLDRIAEICARSRYSLSNQYEVHYTPHGSGASFLTPSAQPNDSQGPTLQVVSADDERSVGTSTRRRRRMARRNSRAMGTLETIISSSRSSDEERPGKNKSAAEIAEQIRGRAAQKGSGHSSPSNSSSITPELQDSHNDESKLSPAVPKKSTSSLALIDAAGRGAASLDAASPRTSATGLVSEPALPQESTSQLETRTAPGDVLETRRLVGALKGGYTPPKHPGLSVAKGAITPVGADTASSGILSVIHGWMPWKSSATSAHHHKGLAEGSLRELLKTSDPKGKGLERME